MRKLPWLVAVALPAAALAAASLPAFGEGRDVGEGACASQPANVSAGPLDLEKIPVKPVAGRQAVAGVGGCEDDGFIDGRDRAPKWAARRRGLR